MTIKDLFKIIFDVDIDDVADYEGSYSPFWNKKLTAEDIDAMSNRIRTFIEEHEVKND